MDNKGFAITGIIYTLFILFLLILLTVLTGLNSYQRLMVNSTKSLEDDFDGEEVAVKDALENNKTKYLGKYIFKVDNNNDDVIDETDTIECSAYLNKGVNFSSYTTANDFSDNIANLSPQICNTLENKMKLIRVYSFEGDNLYEKK